MKVKLALVHRALIALGVAAGVALPLQMAAAQVTGATRVTDARVLQSMGFAPNASNVYMDNKVGRAAAANADSRTTLTTPTTGVDFSASAGPSVSRA